MFDAREPDVEPAIGCGLGETATNSRAPLLRATNFVQIDTSGSRCS